MPEKPKDDPAQKEEMVPVKMERGLHRKAKTVAAARGQGVYEYLDSLLRPAVERDHQKLFGRNG